MNSPTAQGCSHAPINPTRGMQVVAYDEDTVLFRCADCGTEHRRPRCIAPSLSRPNQRRCLASARLGYKTCRIHWKSDPAFAEAVR